MIQKTGRLLVLELVSTPEFKPPATEITRPILVRMVRELVPKMNHKRQATRLWIYK